MEYSPICEPTCQNLDQNCSEISTTRKPGCYCKSGFVKDCNGTCVNAIQYCKICGPFEYYTECGQSPQPSCDNFKNSSSTNNFKGCTCKDKYLRNMDNICVLPTECPCMLINTD